jgi:zinc and cadmium transporter
LAEKTDLMSLIAALLFFLLPMIAGGAVDRLRPGAQWLRLLLSFSGAFLVGIVFLHMLPELYEAEGGAIGAWVLAGFLLQIVLEFFSRGIEHGHLHTIPGRTVPLVTRLSLCIHAFVEGMPFADPGVAGNIPFLGGVLLHKMPMAIALGAVIQRSGIERGRGFLLLLVFAVSAPLGVAVGHFAGEGLGEEFLHSVLGLAIGMLLHIGTTIIFESAPEHRIDKGRFAAVLVGVALAALTAH